MTRIVIDPDTILADYDHHFRVIAGPGAGKTHWLVNHVIHVIRTSPRLSPCSQVCCISYTNVAVNEIRARLGRSANRAYVSTIHSFLYNNVVKPYLHLLKNESGDDLVKYALVDGHDEHRPTFSAVKEWLGSVNAKIDFYKNQQQIFSYLKKVHWRHDDCNGEWLLESSEWDRPKYLPSIKSGSYKHFYWRIGVIDHDDVLYFAYRILEENPLVCEFLSCRFPFLFIDEFQDTNPVQTQVAKWLADHNTMVGVVGDPEQSIYGFQGATPKDFVDFRLPGQIDYVINDNRRSTDCIIHLLNHVRGDGIEQKGLRNIQGESVQICVGEGTKVVSHLQRPEFLSGHLTILTRRNDEASKIRRLTSPTPDEEPWELLVRIDRDRCHFLEHLMVAGQLAKARLYSLALAKLIRGIRISGDHLREPFKLSGPITALERRGLAVWVLQFVVDHDALLYRSTLLESYKTISRALSDCIGGLSLKGVRSGDFQDFAVEYSYGVMADALRLTDETRSTRTIHQAKNTEFANVLVAFGDNKSLDHILEPAKTRSDSEAEEKRITYVALSRTRDRLMLSVPELSAQDESRIANLGISVIRIDRQ